MRSGLQYSVQMTMHASVLWRPYLASQQSNSMALRQWDGHMLRLGSRLRVGKCTGEDPDRDEHDADDERQDQHLAQLALAPAQPQRGPVHLRCASHFRACCTSPLYELPSLVHSPDLYTCLGALRMSMSPGEASTYGTKDSKKDSTVNLARPSSAFSAEGKLPRSTDPIMCQQRRGNYTKSFNCTKCTR